MRLLIGAGLHSGATCIRRNTVNSMTFFRKNFNVSKGSPLLHFFGTVRLMPFPACFNLIQLFFLFQPPDMIVSAGGVTSAGNGVTLKSVGVTGSTQGGHQSRQVSGFWGGRKSQSGASSRGSSSPLSSRSAPTHAHRQFSIG